MKTRGKADGHEIIIKRRSKKGHEQEHGGAWKVAFADFTLAMMALFMVLWIIQPPMDKTFPGFGDQETNPMVDGANGVFDATSPTPMEFDGVAPGLVRRRVSRLLRLVRLQDRAGDPPQLIDRGRSSGFLHAGGHLRQRYQPGLLAVPADESEQPGQKGQSGSEQGQDSESVAKRYSSTSELQALADLMRDVARQVDALANVEVTVVPQGLRILIKDDQQRFMFQRGSATLNPHFQKLLGVLAEVLVKVDNKLIISGHTDATPYRQKNGYNNWNLSGDRALRARNALVDAGLTERAVLQVTAQADVMPLHPEDPQNGANRRVEILLLTASAEALYKELFGDSYGQVRFSESGASYSGKKI